MSISIEELKLPLADHSKLRKEIIGLARRNTHHINDSVFDETNPLFDYIATREEIRTELLLNRIGKSNHEKLHFLVVKDSDNKQLVAYAVLNPTIGQLDRVAITVLVVHENYRKKGIFGLLINHIQQNFTEVAVTCFPSLVPLYEKFGFKIVNTKNALIALEFGQNLPFGPGQILSIDDEYVISHPKSLNAYREIEYKYGKESCDKGLAKWKSNTEDAIEFAKVYFEERKE